MSVIEKLKAESLRLRKERNPIAASITFALSEIEKVGKNNGNRATTENEAIKVVQKLISSIDENLKLNIDEVRMIALNQEKQILASVLPQMATKEEVRQYLIDTYGGDCPSSKKAMMDSLRNHFGALVDMRAAAEIGNTLYGV